MIASNGNKNETILLIPEGFNDYRYFHQQDYRVYGSRMQSMHTDLSMAHRCREMEAIRRRNTWTVNDDEPSPPFLSTIFSNDLARLYSKQWNYSQIIRKAGGLVIFILLFFLLWLFPIRWFVLIERFREMWRGLVWRQFFLLLFFFFTFLRGRKSSWHCFFGERRKEERHPLRLR